MDPNQSSKSKSPTATHSGPELTHPGRYKFFKWVAFGFGSGYAPWAPGTFGSMIGVLLFYGFRLVYFSNTVSSTPALSSYWSEVAIIIALFIIGWYAIKIVESEMGTHDDPGIVIDEIIGQWIALLPIVGTPQPFDLLIGFILFRFFDILKPWPIRWLDQKIHTPMGTILDDVAAGVAAGIILYGIKTLL